MDTHPCPAPDHHWMARSEGLTHGSNARTPVGNLRPEREMTLRLPMDRSPDQARGVTGLSYLLKHLFGAGYPARQHGRHERLPTGQIPTPPAERCGSLTASCSLCRIARDLLAATGGMGPVGRMGGRRAPVGSSVLPLLPFSFERSHPGPSSQVTAPCGAVSQRRGAETQRHTGDRRRSGAKCSWVTTSPAGSSKARGGRLR